MERRQNGGQKCRIVQEFVKKITNDTERLVCFLYMKNHDDREIRRVLKLSQKQLNSIKLKLAFDLRNAGITVGG